jgi:4a-hydroxytetrahydrobiopterin dehydratase
MYNTVEVQLSTHDAGNIVTDKDRALANLLDEI